jgi:hypothetical protein
VARAQECALEHRLPYQYAPDRKVRRQVNRKQRTPKQELHMRNRKTTLIITVLAAFALGACSTDSATGPGALTGSTVFGLSAQEQALKDAKKALHDRLKDMADSIKKEQKATKDRNKSAFDVLKREWDAYKKEWAEYKKDNKDARVELLRCAPLEYAGDAEVIGPDGGDLHVGPHKLVIPRGALTEETLLVAEAPMGSLVQVMFGPHGLRFGVSSQLTLSYAHCMRPENFTYRIVYTDDKAKKILEFPPSTDSKTLKAVTAPIDHFSSYIIAY